MRPLPALAVSLVVLGSALLTDTAEARIKVIVGSPEFRVPSNVFLILNGSREAPRQTDKRGELDLVNKACVQGLQIAIKPIPFGLTYEDRPKECQEVLLFKAKIG